MRTLYQKFETILQNTTKFIIQDYGDNNWVSNIKSTSGFDLIISGYSIQHIDSDKKKRLYNDIWITNQGNRF